MSVETQCPECGAAYSEEAWVGGLCPRCAMALALDPPVEPDSEAPTLVGGEGALTPGQVRANRYRIVSLLGRGGMGEVWRAHDLKLRVDVALKAVLVDQLAEERALQALRDEVRTAREVVSPNVCRVFDLIEVDGQELVSMEYIDGITLADILTMRAPLDLAEARQIAAQFLSGLEAIHQAGLVHRDIKPENLMMTRSGRVVVMDFGIAKALAGSRSGTVVGTPAYMAPEQMRGEAVDARADVFAAGIVLAEMIAPTGLRDSAAREALWRGLHQDPPQISDAPWAPVVRRAVSRNPERRFTSASAMARALEEVTLRVEGAEDLTPYPGLASFTEEDAEYFFGREFEVEAMWKKLERPQLLALVGPSGAGKSSFVRAGLLPVIPSGWTAITTTPGHQPFRALARALVPALAGDTEGLQLLTSPDDPEALLGAVQRLRRGWDKVLLLIDQFEELFTLNPQPVQQEFAALLGRLTLEADVHVLLSMRDDFLLHCQRFESLAPVFSEMSPLGPPAGGALRRAIVQPALKCGYRFEDESLVEEMLSEVEGERGALPLLAFAAARLWETRDRDKGLLTRQAYEFIGGVGGALAQHAEETLDRIGQESAPVVREIFRNLVTAQGTRAARDREDLLSVFTGGETGADSESAARVLDSLIDARLLTSYEVAATAEGEKNRNSVEIVHESLLTHWPRLVRWQNQDADSAQVRDQVRQAAEIWERRGRPNDLLWTGTSFKEFELWRSRYEGGLSEAEERFAQAMTAKALAGKRRRHLAVATAFIVLSSVLGVVSFLWRRGEAARREAIAAARHAEASELIALGRLELQDNPTAALAYGIASLEVADQNAGRLFVLESLWRGPIGFVLDDRFSWRAWFSPDGEWLAVGGKKDHLQLWSREGGPARDLPGKQSLPVTFSPDSSLLVTAQRRTEESLWTWSIPEGRVLHTEVLEDVEEWDVFFMPDDGMVMTVEIAPEWDRLIWRQRPLGGGEVSTLGESPVFYFAPCNAADGRWLGFGADREVFAGPLDNPASYEPRLVGRLDAGFAACALDIDHQRLAAIDEEGTVRLWNLASAATDSPWRSFSLGARVGADSRATTFSPNGRFLVAGATDQVLRVWDLEAPPDSAPMLLRRGEVSYIIGAVVDPSNRWLATADSRGAVLWPLISRSSYVLRGHSGVVSDIAFTPDGRRLVSSSMDRSLRIWPLDPETALEGRVLDKGMLMIERVEIEPSGHRLALTTSSDGPFIVPTEGGKPIYLQGLQFNPLALAWDARGRWIASGGGGRQPEDALIRLWNLESSPIQTGLPGAEKLSYITPTQTLDAGDRKAVSDIVFLSESELLSAGEGGLRRWSTQRETFEQLLDEPSSRVAVAPDGRTAVVSTWGTAFSPGVKRVFRCDLAGGGSSEILTHGDSVTALDLDPAGTVLVTGDQQGVVRVGSIDGSEPHLLYGHTAAIHSVVVSPDGRWIASASADTTIRLWPMPDIAEPPLHTLPRQELLARLHALTNLRAVRDAESATGWSLDIGRFPGWKDLPEW